MIDIDENIKFLYNKFIEIKNMGWIESKRKGNTGVGYTFEELLNKPEENFPIADFNGIEIKTGRRHTRRDIHLFSTAPDGDFLFPNERILKYVGYPDKTFTDVKIFNMNFNAKNFKKIGLFKEGKIVVNREKQKINFIARKFENKKYFNIDVSWSFKMLEDKLNLKLKYLARIIADAKIINGVEYFNYQKITFYKLKGFNTFIDLIEKGYIDINFNIGVFKSGPKIGKIHDRGVGFSIKEKDIDMLFDRLTLDF